MGRYERFLGFVCLAVMLPMIAAPRTDAAESAAGLEHEVGILVNDAREAAGLATLVRSADLDYYSRRHAATMAITSRLRHSDDLAGATSSPWLEIAEIVGTGPDVATIADRFLRSQVHRDIVVGDYDAMGIGVADADGTLWVTVTFVRVADATQPVRRHRNPPAPPLRYPSCPGRFRPI